MITRMCDGIFKTREYSSITNRYVNLTKTFHGYRAIKIFTYKTVKTS